MSNLISAVLSGMNAATIGMSTAQHNIANASTPGFSRQQVQLSSRAGQPSGDGFIGQGVDIAGVKRIYSDFLNTQLLNEQAQASYLDTYYTSVMQIDNLVADPVAGISPAIQELFGAVNVVSSKADSTPARQTMLSAAQFTVTRFKEINNRFDDIASGINQQINSSVGSINSYAQQIAVLNGNIQLASASDPNNLPNDLLDQRAHVLSELNKFVRVTTSPQADGALNVFIGNGQSLVVDDQAMMLKSAPSSTDPSKLELSYSNGFNTAPIQQNTLQGGQLGALLAFRDQSLEPSRNALGRVAIAMAANFNTQNQLGQDLNGVLGGNIFSSPVPIISSSNTNTGTAQIIANISNTSALTTSDYQLRFDGTDYSTLRLSDNQIRNLGPTLPQTVDGVDIDIASGTPQAGDVFLIRPTSAGARDLSVTILDPNKIAAAAPIRTDTKSNNLGTGKVSAGTVNTPLPLDPNLQHNVTIHFIDANNYSVTDTNTGATLTASTAFTPNTNNTITFNGWTLDISGAPTGGDEFYVTPNTNGRADNRNALLMVKMQTSNLMVNGTATFQSAYGQMVGDVGATTHQMQLTSQAQATMVQQLETTQQAVSGVNLDEEAASLMQFQRNYQAIAKAMQVSTSMFDTLLSVVGR